MKTFVPFLLCLLAAPVGAVDLTVQLKGATPKGALMLALYDAPTDFPGKGSVQRLKIEPGSGNTAVFKGLAPGRYAIAAFQDENGNSQLDRNALGIPTEPYGFSRNARGAFGPPKFEEAAVALNDAPQQIVIDLE